MPCSIYGCDFVNTALEGAALVRRVAMPGFALHLAAGGLSLNDESAEAIEAALPLVRHVHISEPHLLPIGGGAVTHARFAAILRGGAYAHWVSIEMREQTGDATLEHVSAALQYASEVYAASPTGTAR